MVVRSKFDTHTVHRQFENCFIEKVVAWERVMYWGGHADTFTTICYQQQLLEVLYLIFIVDNGFWCMCVCGFSHTTQKTIIYCIDHNSQFTMLYIIIIIVCNFGCWLLTLDDCTIPNWTMSSCILFFIPSSSLIHFRSVSSLSFLIIWIFWFEIVSDSDHKWFSVCAMRIPYTYITTLFSSVQTTERPQRNHSLMPYALSTTANIILLLSVWLFVLI